MPSRRKMSGPIDPENPYRDKNKGPYQLQQMDDNYGSTLDALMRYGPIEALDNTISAYQLLDPNYAISSYFDTIGTPPHAHWDKWNSYAYGGKRKPTQFPSRGAGTRKRLYKGDGDENDPRERGKKMVGKEKTVTSVNYDNRDRNPSNDYVVLNQNSSYDPRTRWNADAFRFTGGSPNYLGTTMRRIFKLPYPDAYHGEAFRGDFPMQFAYNSPEMEALNALNQQRNPLSGLVVRESRNPVADMNRLLRNPSKVVEYQSRSSRGAGTRKRLYKNDDEENDPRKRGKKFIENIKSGLSSAYNFVANPIKEVATNAPRQAREIYERGKSGGERVRFQGKDPLSRFAQRGVDSIYDAGKVVRSAENSAENTRRKVDFANRAIRETPRVISDMYEGGRTGKKARTNALGEDLIRNIAGIHGFIQGVNEGIRGSGEKGNTKKRATAPKMARKTTAASSRQAGFVNGRPVSLKKRANTSMKYFK